MTQVQPGSAAESAGLEAGDIVVAADGTAIDSSSALRNRIGLTPVGEDIELTVLRDGRRRTIEVEIGKTGQLALAGGDTFDRLRGADFRNMDANDRRLGDVAGVLVASVEQGSPAWRNGIREGDIVLAVNRVRVKNLDQLSEALERSGGTIALSVLRGNARLFIVVQ